MINITRGSDVTFSSSFTTSLNQAYTPNNANVKLSYTISGVATLTTIAMSLDPNDNKWRATWTTTSADAGQVDWFIYASGNSGSTDQGSFLLVANTANPQQ